MDTITLKLVPQVNTGATLYSVLLNQEILLQQKPLATAIMALTGSLKAFQGMGYRVVTESEFPEHGKYIQMMRN